VLSVAALIDVEAAVQQYAALRRLPVLEFLFAVVILEAGEATGSLAAQHKVFLLHRLELLQMARADHGPARGRCRAPARRHRRDDDREDRRRRRRCRCRCRRRRLRRCRTISDYQRIPRVRGYKRFGPSRSTYHSHDIPATIVPARFPLPAACSFLLEHASPRRARRVSRNVPRARRHTCARWASSSPKDCVTHNGAKVHFIVLEKRRQFPHSRQMSSFSFSSYLYLLYSAFYTDFFSNFLYLILFNFLCIFVLFLSFTFLVDSYFSML